MESARGIGRAGRGQGGDDGIKGEVAEADAAPGAGGVDEVGAVGSCGGRDAGVQGGPEQDEVRAAGEPAGEGEVEESMLAAELLEPGAVEGGGVGVDEQAAGAGDLVVAVAVGGARTLKVLDVLAFQADEAGDAVGVYEVDPGIPGGAVPEEGWVVATYAALKRDAGDRVHGIRHQSAEHCGGEISVAG